MNLALYTFSSYVLSYKILKSYLCLACSVNYYGIWNIYGIYN